MSAEGLYKVSALCNTGCKFRHHEAEYLKSVLEDNDRLREAIGKARNALETKKPHAAVPEAIKVLHSIDGK